MTFDIHTKERKNVDRTTYRVQQHKHNVQMHFVTSINYQTKEQNFFSRLLWCYNAQLMQDRMNFLPSVKQISLGMSLV